MKVVYPTVKMRCLPESTITLWLLEPLTVSSQELPRILDTFKFGIFFRVGGKDDIGVFINTCHVFNLLHCIDVIFLLSLFILMYD